MDLTTHTTLGEEDTSVKDLFRPLVEYRRYIIAFFVSTVLFSLLLTYIYSEKYQAATTIVFQPQEVTLLRQKELMAFGAPLPTAPFDLIYDNLQLLTQSEPVLLQVVDEFHLDVEQPKVYDGPFYIRWFKKTKDFLKQMRDDTWTFLKHGRMVKDNPRTAALKGLREHLSLIDHNSYVFYLAYVDNDPQRAARIVDRIAELVVQELLDSQKNPGLMREQQLQGLRDAKQAQIENYQVQIENLLTNNSTSSVDLEIENSMSEYSELTLDKVKLASKIAAARARIAAIQAQGSDNPSSAVGLHPDDYRHLKSQEIGASIELDALLKEYYNLEGSIAELEKKLATLPSVQMRYDNLNQKLKTAQRDLVQITDPLQEAEVQASSVLSQVYVPHKARVPSVPVSPIKIYHLALAGGLALCIAFAVAYLAAFMRSDQIVQKVHRVVGSMVGMWDGIERRSSNPAPYSGPERRKGDNSPNVS